MNQSEAFDTVVRRQVPNNYLKCAGLGEGIPDAVFPFSDHSERSTLEAWSGVLDVLEHNPAAVLSSWRAIDCGGPWDEADVGLVGVAR